MPSGLDSRIVASTSYGVTRGMISTATSMWVAHIYADCAWPKPLTSF
jgi:hypothetical protein